MRVLRDLFLMVAVVAGLMAGSQVPSFVDAYAQRLGGALDEARRQVAGYETAAAGQGLSFDAYIARHLDSRDPVFQATGREIQNAVRRADALASLHRDLIAAGPWTRPVAALLDADPEILANAYRDWRPGWSVDPRWGAVGLALAWLVFLAVSALVRRGFGRRQTT